MNAWFRNVSAFLLVMFFACRAVTAQQTDALLQGFYWNTNPGDVTSGGNVNGGIWWDSLKTVAPELGRAGFGTVWFPPPTKGAGGRFDMGYGLYDYYDLGKYDWHYSVRTRFGNETQLRSAVAAMKANGVKVMADAVLNHRMGANSQSMNACGTYTSWNVYTPLSNRFPASAINFNPTPTGDPSSSCQDSGDYFQAFFGSDNSYFNNTNSVLINGAANNGWYFGPHNLGNTGDSLVVWGRWLMNNVGFDEFRIDAVKHIQPAFMAPWLVELKNGTQPFAMGEFYDGSALALKTYADQVNNFNGTFGRKNANLAMLDFNLYFIFKSILNNSGGGGYAGDLNNYGLIHNGMAADKSVLFIENHDFDRGGYKEVACTATYTIKVGNACLLYFFEPDHNATYRDKHMAYGMYLGMEPRTSIFWKDYYWYGLRDEINWLLNLRRGMAKGTYKRLSDLNPTVYQVADFWGYTRAGTGAGSGLAFALSDATSEQSAWMNTPWTNTTLKDYSDAYMFVTSDTYSDTRANLKAGARNYAWYAPTGRYTIPTGSDAPRFAMTATEGGKLHYVVLRASDMANFKMASGRAFAAGDQIAIRAANSTRYGNVAGIGRVGQAVTWDGVNDIVIEVLGNASDNTGNRLKTGDPLVLSVYDKQTNTVYGASGVTWLANASTFTFKAKRPATRGAASFGLSVNNALGTYSVGGISVLTGFMVNLATATEAVDNQEAPKSAVLNPVYPNPLNQEGVISFSVKESQKVQVTLVDALGRTVDTLFEGTVPAQMEQRFTLTTDGLNSGNYWVRLKGENGVNEVKSITIIK